MVLTGPQTTSFFEDQDQMAIPHATVIQLQHEGISQVSYLADFDKSAILQITENLRKPGDRIPNPDPGATIPRPPFVFGAKSQMRVLAACDLIRFYVTIGRMLTAGNIRWDPIIKDFKIQWKALEDCKKADKPDTPKISKALPIIKWTRHLMTTFIGSLEAVSFRWHM